MQASGPMTRPAAAAALFVLLAGCKSAGSPAGGPGVDAPRGTSSDASSSPSDGTAASSCAGSTAVFCEDFEDRAVGPATSSRWTTDTMNGTLAVDTARARGARSLHVNTTGNGRARILVPIAPALAGNSMFGRMYAYITAFPTAPLSAHYTLVEASGASTDPNKTLVRPIGGQYETNNAQPAADYYGPGSDGGASGDWTNWQVSAPAEPGKWVTFEWQLSAADNQISVWIDGVARPELTVSRTDHGGEAVDFVFPTFTQIWFGWWLYQGNPTPDEYELWIDDIAIDSAKIGC